MKPTILGLAHATVDGSAGWILGSLADDLDSGEIAGLLLLYNILGFGLQPFVGLVVDRHGSSTPAVLSGLSAQVVALLTIDKLPWLSVGIAGLGSAFFHVGAGAIALGATPGRATGVGLFAAPGVLGLGIGGSLATAGVQASWGFITTLVTLLGWLSWSLPRIHSQPEVADVAVGASEEPSGRRAIFEMHDLLMMGILAAIALRSLTWTALGWIMEERYGSLLTLSAAASLGKVTGGFLADRFGWKRWTFLSLSGSGLLTYLGTTNEYNICITAALLQSATPAMLAGLLTWLPGRQSLVSGLGFGLAISLGGLPFALGMGDVFLRKELLFLATCVAAVLSFLLTPLPFSSRRRAVGLPERTFS